MNVIVNKLRAANRWTGIGLETLRYAILGREINRGLVFKLFLYWILIITAYIYLNPVMKMIVKMVMNEKDLVDPTVAWIPNEIYWGHLGSAWQALNYAQTLTISMMVSGLVAVFHIITCGLMGYALARMSFPFKKLLVFLLVMSFIIPPQVIVLPMIIMYTKLGFQNHLTSLVIPAIFGFGIKGALFVIIFRQFYTTQPKELEEAAKIDGASAFRFYWRVMFPLAKPAVLIVGMFSFVWTWNDTYYPRMFLGQTDNVPLAMQMSFLDNSIKAMLSQEDAAPVLIEAIKMSASFLTIAPLLAIFFFAQRYLMESVERSGIVE
ncbi:carbohydrate ABC transporter permease [Paenibacillus spongiae]|uniref:Carbohydrate ABC transporter permease n=1 Tax=Paenibacillus spongiae TaxID=2909671 RepID=A0ABY5S9D9_9BACL|nr:carbohydrate ABC transporter permease [Paenibacillus spongiae]UVI30185.1 carbohydrate ABC transporter permease [Paenibacillus spongiae]